MIIDHTTSAVVTGGASGLGEATARALAGKGAKVAVFDMNEERGEAIAAEIGGVFCKVDVSDEASVEAGFTRARAAHGQERVLVNCAGIAPVGKLVKRDRETGAISHHSVDLFRKTMAINLVGSFICMAKSAAGMMTLDPVGEYGERGAIVNTASVAAEDGQIGQVAYASSKAAVKGMTLPVARDLMGEGIRVNAILPGIFRTPMLAGLPEKAQAGLAEAVPFPKRLGDPAEYASLVCFMVETGYFNGECVRLDGAIRMPPK
ncbi:SDR family oxidoreductase [Erythrobacter arachoides]|uniref:SDR family oxidoreductase n=1 Tax=Aurantiacibacter arachoides TaxID=1850444 RepID=A0A844ZXF5_9SPHN|nr:SDR family NAD(P)-dependent oxidoreductase [Aurantiacibacter arachoides]MXO92418.1 SDR family oxidoreductase [Aurantiacibacter arachoides]GGD57318.1 3-hydroxyacyl-CoA dehydrogenase [Aurantiacibacter arachoides]